MRPEELKEILDRRPFHPIRLHMSTGEAVDVKHPDAAIVARTTVVVGLGMNPEGIADRTTWYNLLHIVKIERIERDGGKREGRRRKSA